MHDTQCIRGLSHDTFQLGQNQKKNTQQLKNIILRREKVDKAIWSSFTPPISLRSIINLKTQSFNWMCLGTDILGRTGLTPVTDANFLQLGRGSSLSRASHNAIQIPYLVGENFDLQLKRGFFPPYPAYLNLALRSQSGVYLRSLRKYINHRGVFFNEGWSVDFFCCQNSCETSAVYCSPDRKWFATMDDVARHLEFKRRQSLKAESRNDVSASHQSSIHAPQVRKNSLKLSRGNSSRENQNGGRILSGPVSAPVCRSFHPFFGSGRLASLLP